MDPGSPYEYGIAMRRMPDELRLATLVDQSKSVLHHLDALARLIADLHATADRGPHISAEGTAVGLRRRWTDNLRETEKYRDGHPPALSRARTRRGARWCAPVVHAAR